MLPQMRAPTFSLTLLLLAYAVAACARGGALRFDRVFSLSPDEGVFAYARISPDGGSLAYASERRTTGVVRGISEDVTVINLTTKRVEFREAGIDGWWSNDGARLIFRNQSARRD